jgi:hypothetical protein
VIQTPRRLRMGGMSASAAVRRRRTLRLTVATVALVGVSATACSGHSARTAVHQVPAVPAPRGTATPFVTAPANDPVAAPAGSPEEAVQRYVTAEAAGDDAASFALLSDDERRRVGSLAAWADEASDRLPIDRIDHVTLDGSTVVTEATLAARLDETGFVPGAARIEWRPVHVEGGWLISPSATTVTPHLPDDDGARAAVQTWLDARRSGQTTGQYEGNLLGQPTLVERVSSAALRAGAPTHLESSPDPQVAINAFGPDASRFVRAVPVDGVGRLVVLAAPLGDAWKVVGIEADH